MMRNSAAYRVMIVDDEPILRTGICHLCNWNEHGIEIVAQASNGQEALQYVDKVKPHVIITDIVMPVMDGIEFVKMMRKLHPEVKLVVLSSYSEFDYVREVFKYGVTDYLLKPKVSAAELVPLIQSLCGDMDIESDREKPVKSDPSLVLAQLLSNERNDDNDAWARLSESYSPGQFRMLRANTELLLSITKWTQSQIEDRLIQLAEEHLSQYKFTTVFLKNECLVLVNYNSDEAKAVKQSLRVYAESVKQELNFIIFVMTSGFDSFALVKEKYEQLTACMGKLFYFPQQSIVSVNEMKTEMEKITFDHTQFSDHLRMLAIHKAKEQLNAFCATIRHTQAYDEYSLKRLCQNIIYTVTSSLEHMKLPLPAQGMSRLRLFKEIDHAFNISELESIVTQFLDEVESVIHRHTDQQQSFILNKIYDYVNENYANDISLTDLSEELHLNYSYLSSYFKQRTNENLTSFINRVRTDKAKELLTNAELSISEISRMTGFSEHNYFSKVFKKMTGMTPVEYRNQIFHQ